MRFRLTEKFRLLLEHEANDFIKEMRRFKNNPEEALTLLQDYYEQANQTNSSVFKFTESNKAAALILVKYLCSIKEDQFYSVLSWLEKLDLSSLKNLHIENLCKIITLVLEGRIDKKAKFLQSAYMYSLLNRNKVDFDYTIKILEIVYNPSELKKYFNGATQVNPDDLYEGSKIKAAGIIRKDPDDLGTIYGTVAMWEETYKHDKGEATISRKDRSTKSEFQSFDDLDKAKASKDKIVHIEGDFEKVDGKLVPYKKDKK